MKPTLLALALGTILCFPLASARDVKLTGKQILRLVDTQHRAKDEVATVELVLVDAKGAKRKREMRTTFKAAAKGDDDKTITTFLSPPDVRGTAVLTVEQSGRADDQWVFLPALKKAKRIASSHRSNRFAGTDFTFEDLRTEDFSASTYARKADVTVKGERCYVVEATPKAGKSSGYSKRVIVVEAKRNLIMEIRFHDKAGKLKKTLQYGAYEKVKGLWRTKFALMSDHQRKTKTAMRFVKRKLNSGLSDRLFTVSAIERGA